MESDFCRVEEDKEEGCLSKWTENTQLMFGLDYKHRSLVFTLVLSLVEKGTVPGEGLRSAGVVDIGT